MNEIIYPLFFLVALVYGSVGHGGASGYLAVLALFGFAPKEMAASALILNLLVAGTSFFAYWRSGYFSPKLFWPFALTSVPMAMVGGFLDISPVIYAGLLMVSLVFAAIRLALGGLKNGDDEFLRPLSLSVALPIGAGIGLLSGIVGVGGGIFLSPLLIMMRWADAKQTAAASAAFIWVNSCAGLYGHVARQGVNVADHWPLILAAFLGGLIGSHLGAKQFKRALLRRVMAGVLTVAAYKMLCMTVIF